MAITKMESKNLSTFVICEVVVIVIGDEDNDAIGRGGW